MKIGSYPHPPFSINDEIFPCNEEFVGNPNYDCWDIQINSAGFRNPEIVKQKTDGVFRIIAVGGSTTFAGETYEDTWAGHLQKIIDKEISEIEVEVINAGESGATTKNELQLIKTKLIEFEPDLIIMYDGWNDSANIPVEETIQNWQNICEFGNENGFSTSIFIQPLPASGDRITALAFVCANWPLYFALLKKVICPSSAFAKVAKEETEQLSFP